MAPTQDDHLLAPLDLATQTPPNACPQDSGDSHTRPASASDSAGAPRPNPVARPGKRAQKDRCDPYAPQLKPSGREIDHANTEPPMPRRGGTQAASPECLPGASQSSATPGDLAATLARQPLQLGGIRCDPIRPPTPWSATTRLRSPLDQLVLLLLSLDTRSADLRYPAVEVVQVTDRPYGFLDRCHPGVL